MSERLRQVAPTGGLAARRDRAEPRSKVFQLAGLILAGHAERAHILDISANGARLHCAAQATVHDEVELHAGATRVRGYVVWAAGGRLGVRFHRRLSWREVDAMIG